MSQESNAPKKAPSDTQKKRRTMTKAEKCKAAMKAVADFRHSLSNQGKKYITDFKDLK